MTKLIYLVAGARPNFIKVVEIIEDESFKTEIK